MFYVTINKKRTTNHRAVIKVWNNLAVYQLILAVKFKFILGFIRPFSWFAAHLSILLICLLKLSLSSNRINSSSTDETIFIWWVMITLFFIYIVFFWVSLSMFMIFLIWFLFYACNRLNITKSVVKKSQFACP